MATQDSKLNLNSRTNVLLRRSAGRGGRGASLSGHERNHLFFSTQGKQFYDISSISGLDHPGDSRGFARLDYDRDGWQDIALVNANAPLLQLYRNQIADEDTSGKGQMLALRFVGGNHTVEPSAYWSNRDGYGAVVTVSLDDLTILREHRAGEGKAAQNSATLVIGIGDRTQAESIVVRWPSGVVQETRDVPAGTLVTVYENPAQQPDGRAFAFEPYKRRSQSKRETDTTLVSLDTLPHRNGPNAGSVPARLLLNDKRSTGAPPKLRMYTTMAAWCAACKRELPQLQRLRALFGPDVLQMSGVPIDAGEAPEKLKAYVAQYQPAYELRMDLTASQVTKVQEIVKGALKLDGLPATIVTNSNGYVLRTMWGVPSGSEIHQLLAALQ